MGEIIKEEFKIKGLYLGYSEDANSDPIPGNMPMDSNLVPGFEERPPFCLELKGMAIGQDLITSFTTPDFVKGNAYKNNMFDNIPIILSTSQFQPKSPVVIAEPMQEAWPN